MSHEALNATVIERHDLHGELSIVKVRPDSGCVPPFSAGQFMTLGLPKPEEAEPPAAKAHPHRRPGPRLIKRAYSIASSPNVRDHMEFFVVLVAEGKLTPKLWTVGAGGRLWMDTKAKGTFTLADVPAGRNLVMISSGTGIAPFMSMLRTDHGTGRWRRVVVINGTRQAEDLGYREELEQLAREDSGLVYVPVLSREPQESAWAGLRGRVQVALEPATFERLAGIPLDPGAAHVLLCGNPAMIDDVQALLEARGFQQHTKISAGNIHLERYW